MIGSSVLAGTAIHKIKNALDGQRMATEDMTVHDKYGREMKIKKGDSFNINDIDPDERDFVKSKSKIDETYMGKIFRKTWNKFGEIGTGIKSRIFFAENQSVKETTNGSHNTPANEYNNGTNNAQYNQATDSIDNTHSTSPSSNSTSSINDKNENVKILKLFFVFWFISKNKKCTKNGYYSHC